MKTKTRRAAAFEKPVASFATFYKDRFEATAMQIPAETIAKANAQILKASKQERSTIHLLGNGGSCAILRHLEFLLRQKFGKSSHGIRISNGIDFHSSQWTANTNAYMDVFTRKLEEEHTDSRDLVVLMTASGDSDNVIRAAQHCKRVGISTLSFAGFDGGKISRGITDNAVVAKISDQQICEDVLQAILWTIINPEQRVEFILNLVRCLSRIDSSILFEMSDSIVSAYFYSRAVFILAPEAGPLSTAAEHVAHNLNWDAVFKIDNPPKRFIFSTPTNCDFSGIGNDRLHKEVVFRQQLDKAQEGDVLVIFSHERECDAVKNTLLVAKGKGMKLYVLSKDNFGSSEQFSTADLLQIVGHMTGRITRSIIKLRLGLCSETELESVLLTEDMAQRRLLHADGI